MKRTAADLAALERDGKNCRRCYRNLEGQMASLHHRKLKGRKVPKSEWDLVENIVLLCGSGTTGCHGWAHHNRPEAERTGWIVPSWENPASVPMVTLNGQTLWFDTKGGQSQELPLPVPAVEVPF